MNPIVHEIFTWVWLADLSSLHGREITLGNVPDEVWDDVARPGIDFVWLMGVWKRSPLGAQIARTHPSMQAAHRAALPGLADADVVGSAYCVADYVVDRRLGGESGLALARAALARRGVRLVLDLVPNHVAPDHPWVHDHPEFFIEGTPADLAREPHAYLQIGDRVLACGRDPYFPAWPEVLQLDASHVGLRAAMVELVAGLTRRCDGVRCDMAMLVLDDVFARTWGDRASGGPHPDGGRGYWPRIIGATRHVRPDFAFWAEAYWDLEPVLLEQGFDACYDKRLYDRLVQGSVEGAIDVASVRAHLGADLGHQRRTIRFVENHDEPRAASLLDPAAHRAALAAVFTLPGIALLHEGEADGRRIRIPVTLGRRPAEPPDLELRAFVALLLAALAGGMRRGVWSLAPIRGWPDNASAERLLGWTWTAADHRHLVVVNPTAARADGRVGIPWTDLEGRTIRLDDLLSGQRFEREGGPLASDGLYVALEGHGVHCFQVT
ncbi:MAG: alpha amylase [Deltaproteobacteria bacterium]|nr:alpha amylase [Deltaproteobacteria bacterium]